MSALALFSLLALPFAAWVPEGPSTSAAPLTGAWTASVEMDGSVESAADSAALLREARSAQARFERLRVFHSPFSHWSSSGRCDEHVGRFCLRFGREDPDEERPSWTPPPDPPRVVEGRLELLATLERVARAHPGDRWVLGQWVVYLAEANRWDEALAVARECEATGWWCDGLEGFVLHGLGRIPEAEAAFRRVLEGLPQNQRREWEDPALLGEVDLWREAGRLEGEEQSVIRERIWTLADPLLLLEGNALWTEHLARWVLSETRRDAQNGHGMRWSDDMTELLVRFGPVLAYERVREPLGHMGPPPVVGRYSGDSRHLMPSWDAVQEPSASAEEDWRTDRRRARSRHGPPAAPRIRGMDVDLTRFRRGDDLLVAAAWRLRSPPPASAEDSARVARGELDPDSLPPPFPPEELETGLFLLDEEGLAPKRFSAERLDPARGVTVARVPSGRYLMSLEAWDREGERAWRRRQGVQLAPLPRGVIALSDVLVLPAEVGAVAGARPRDGPASLPFAPLDSLLRRSVPTGAFPPGLVEIVWEVYGLEATPQRGLIAAERRLPFHLEARRSDQGLLRRAGQALGILSPPGAVVLEWEEGVDVEHLRDGAYLRRIALDLSGLDPGTYELSLTLTPPGRTETVAVRTIEVTSRP